ncbi:MAG TPA: beta-ketoacyl-[acyl-carrier-protein] synthase family protein, partial [Elusimicrobiota bacterium]|nr:beta-ketoacyl-[acyl-carrier-protein] synthase family protein [Elusimicrobiota bacterium]
MKKRVVISGVGVVAPNGLGKEAFWQALTQGLSGVRTIRRYDSTPLASRIAGELADFDPLRYIDARELKKIDRSNSYAIAAAEMALADSGLDLSREDVERIGSSIGNAVGGVDYVKREIDVINDKGPHWTSPYLAIAFFPCGTNGLLSIRLGIKGTVLTVCNGNASGTDAVGLAYRAIQSGRAEIMFAGGAEAPLVPLFVGSLAQDGLLSRNNDDPARALRPFDRSADGMVLAEGAALVVMESLEHAEARGAHIYGEIVGYASGNSACDAFRPDTNGWGLVNTMRRSLAEAGLAPEDVDIVSGQGFSLPDFDAMETRCIRETFQSGSAAPAITAVGSWTGNSLGALGGFQTVAGALMLERRTAPGVANFSSASESAATLSIAPQARRLDRADVVVQNSYCFMG